MFAAFRSRAAALRSVALLAALLACGPARPRPEPAAAPDRSRATDASTTLTREDLDRTRVSRVEELLIARVPGLEVSRTAGGDYTLRIRGSRSFMGSDEPLVVIDGVPVRAGGVSSALWGIMPSDIGRIEVLRDAAATAFYGVRGANGVIVITTRRGP